MIAWQPCGLLSAAASRTRALTTHGQHCKPVSLSPSSTQSAAGCLLCCPDSQPPQPCRRSPIAGLNDIHQRSCAKVIRPCAEATDSKAFREDAQDRKFIQALLLAWFATPSRSLLPLRCAIDTAIEMYQNGLWLQELQLALSVASLESGGQLLAPLESDLLLLWTGTVFLTLRELHFPLHAWARSKGQEASEIEDASPRLKGMLGFVRNMIALHKQGMDSRRLLLQQALAGANDGRQGKGASPTVQIMQQNSRVVVLTLEAVLVPAPQQPADSPTAESAAPMPEPLGQQTASEPEQESAQRNAELVQANRRLGYVEGFLLDATQTGQASQTASGSSGSTDDALQSRESWPEVSSLSSVDISMPATSAGQLERVLAGGHSPARPVAIRVLIAFIGAVQGSLYSVTSFVDNVLSCYRQGWNAGRLYAELTAEDLEQCGGLFKVSAARSTQEADSASPLGSPAARIFAQWLSMVYMAAVQLGVPREGGSAELGWAWVEQHGSSSGGQSAVEANQLYNFVANGLQSQEEADHPSEAFQAFKRQLEAAEPEAGKAAQQQKQQDRPSFAVMEDPSLQQTSSSLSLFKQQVQLVQLVRKRVQDTQAANSTA